MRGTKVTPAMPMLRSHILEGNSGALWSLTNLYQSSFWRNGLGIAGPADKAILNRRCGAGRGARNFREFKRELND